MKYDRAYFSDFMGESQESYEKKVHRRYLELQLTNIIWGLLDQKGMTLEDLAKKLGKSTRSLNSALEGETKLSVDLLADIIFELDAKFDIRLVNGRYRQFDDEAEENNR